MYLPMVAIFMHSMYGVVWNRFYSSLGHRDTFCKILSHYHDLTLYLFFREIFTRFETAYHQCTPYIECSAAYLLETNAMNIYGEVPKRYCVSW